MTDSEYTFLCEYLAQHYTQQFNAYKEEGWGNSTFFVTTILFTFYPTFLFINIS
jgi:hypothetical protein